jgi:molybdenum cofactor cytidylyltransferase
MDANRLLQAFGLGPGPELVAIVGGGGKSSLMFALANAWPGRAITTTTTRIFAAQMKQSPAVVEIGDWGMEKGDLGLEIGDWKLNLYSLISNLQSPLAQFRQCLIVGQVGEGADQEKALGVPPELPGQLLGAAGVDLVVVEADGSRMRPIKAPAAHEPVVPAETTLLIPVVGLDALQRPFPAIAHRPELIEAILQERDIPIQEQLTPEAVAALLTHPQGGLKNAPVGARIVPLLNKAETAEQLAAARQIARLVLRERSIERVVIGAMQSEQPVREVVRRVTAVVLAAGESRRMGRQKLLLPWGETTVLGQVLANIQASDIHDILLVSGHEAAAVEAVAGAYGVPAMWNEAFAAGEMLSSLQTAVRRLPPEIEAVLVVLGDQPLVGTAVINQLLHAYWGLAGPIIAPVYQGQRGNPVLLDRRTFAELLALPPGAAPRDLLRRHADAVHLLEVDDQGVLLDLDRPEAYEQWRPDR